MSMRYLVDAKDRKSYAKTVLSSSVISEPELFKELREEFATYQGASRNHRR